MIDTHTPDTQTDAGNDNTRWTKLASDKNDSRIGSIDQLEAEN